MGSEVRSYKTGTVECTPSALEVRRFGLCVRNVERADVNCSMLMAEPIEFRSAVASGLWEARNNLGSLGQGQWHASTIVHQLKLQD